MNHIDNTARMLHISFVKKKVDMYLLPAGPAFGPLAGLFIFREGAWLLNRQ